MPTKSPPPKRPPPSRPNAIAPLVVSAVPTATSATAVISFLLIDILPRTIPSRPVNSWLRASFNHPHSKSKKSLRSSGLKRALRLMPTRLRARVALSNVVTGILEHWRLPLPCVMENCPTLSTCTRVVGSFCSATTARCASVMTCKTRPRHYQGAIATRVTARVSDQLFNSRDSGGVTGTSKHVCCSLLALRRLRPCTGKFDDVGFPPDSARKADIARCRRCTHRRPLGLCARF